MSSKITNRDVAVGRLICAMSDPEPVVEMVSAYRCDCVKAERERVLLAIESVMVWSPWRYAEETVEQLRVVLERLEKGDE